jgi:hypothetical protein
VSKNNNVVPNPYKNVGVFNNHSGRECDPDDWTNYGITEQKLVIELFRQYGGKLGYYLANLKDKKDYYCTNRFINSFSIE